MKVNILLSTYNGERFLADQIRSIQEQTFSDWTLLIRDDGSTDQTRQIIEEFVREDERIRFINPDDMTNVGVVKSFHALVKYEQADFYFFSDQDDVWLPEKMQMCLDEADLYPSQEPLMVYTDLTIVNQDLEVLAESMIRSQSHHANTELVQELTENTVTGGVAMFNYALAHMWKDSDQIVMHDWYLALLATALGKLVYIDSPGELYRQHGNNVLGSRNYMKLLKKWLRLSNHWELIKKSQKQAKLLLQNELSEQSLDMVKAYVTILDQTFFTRIHLVKKYGFRKNKMLYSIVFWFLIITKFAYVKE